ncbi:MAG: helix-turn-helix domain-containing protein [Dehalococcoidia bacterium]|nr:helix-turn-helix domain-containing protein [Dehalococcoidia bacterium]
MAVPPSERPDTGVLDFLPLHPIAPNGDAGGGGRTRRASRWVSLSRACEILGVNESTVRRWADAGEIQMFRTPGGHRRFDEGDLLGLVERGAQQPNREIESAAITRIRRQLHAHNAEPAWYRETDDDERDALRPLGRRLLQIVDDYLARRGQRSDLEREVAEIGTAYGEELLRRGMPLAQAVQAFTFFRRALDQTAKQLAYRNRMTAEEAAAAREQIALLADRVLLALTSVYDGRPE